MTQFPYFLILIFFVNEKHCFRKDHFMIHRPLDVEGGPCPLSLVIFFEIVSEGYLHI